MKIAHHTWEYPPTIVGGLGTYSQCSTRALADLGHEVVVWSPEQVSWPRTIVPEPHPRVRVHRVPLYDVTGSFPHLLNDDLKHWGGYLSDLISFNMQATFATRQERNVDIIAIQDWLSGIAGLNLARNRPAPIVFHIHSAEWGRQPHDGGSPAVRAFEGGMAWEADAVITVSHAMRDDLLAHGWDASKVHTVWNGVDTRRYRPAAVSAEEVARLRQRYGIPAKAPVALFVGRMVPEKGAVALVEAMAEVRQHVPDAHLVVLGVGQTEADARERVVRFGLEERVHLRGELVPETERIAHFAMCDVGVFPSTYEPFGIVTLEAMAMGKACVAGARGIVGFREQVVAHGPAQTGLHVNGADAGDIAWGLCEAFRDRDRLAAWGVAGRARVEALFTWADSARATESIYRSAGSSASRVRA